METKDFSEKKELMNRGVPRAAFSFPKILQSGSSHNPPSGAASPKPPVFAGSRGRIRPAIFMLLLAVFAVTFFTKDRYRPVKDIRPEVLAEPLQSSPAQTEPIVFRKNGYSYTVTPLYDYDISGLVVSSLKYDSWYSLSRTDSVFLVDLCVIWGGNVRDRAYAQPSLRFSQDYRFCLWTASGRVTFSDKEISNNHLVIEDDRLEKLAKSVSAGDQVRIKGKLARVEARALGETGSYERQNLVWNSSTTRDDTGAGACEVIYVESLEILKKGNPVSHFLFDFSKYGLLAVIVWTLASIFFGVWRDRKRKAAGKP